MKLGASVLRVGGREKVLGETRYGFDQGREGDLYLMCVRRRHKPGHGHWGRGACVHRRGHTGR
jgi:hypothetical protein